MGPLVRQHEWALGRREIGIEQRLECDGCGQPIHACHAEVRREQRRLRRAGHGGTRAPLTRLHGVQRARDVGCHAGRLEGDGAAVEVERIRRGDGFVEQRRNVGRGWRARRQREALLHRRTRVVQSPHEEEPQIERGGEGERGGGRAASRCPETPAPERATRGDPPPGKHHDHSHERGVEDGDRQLIRRAGDGGLKAGIPGAAVESFNGRLWSWQHRGRARDENDECLGGRTDAWHA